MNIKNNPHLRRNAQSLRRAMTKEERKLWYEFLKPLKVTVNRQKVIGRYIVDFYIASCLLAIELDGSQHYEIDGIQNDIERDHFLRKMGINVLRYSNHDINYHFDEVCEDILRTINTPHQSTSSTASPQGEAFNSIER